MATSFPNQSVPPQEAISSCRESQCYLCRVVSAANIANVGLFFIGLFAVVAGLLTLKAINRQADIMERQTKDAAVDVRRLNRAYLTVDSWVEVTDQSGRIGVQFRVTNPSLTAARIDAVEYRHGAHGVKQIFLEPGGRMLTPRETHWYPILFRELHDPDNPHNKVFTIRGKITYTDIFKRTRHRTFAKSVDITTANIGLEDVEGAGWNTEQEWDKDD